MTAVLAAIAAALVVAVLALACLAAMLWAALSPPGLLTLAWLAVVFAVIWGAVEALERLGKRRGGSTR